VARLLAPLVALGAALGVASPCSSRAEPEGDRILSKCVYWAGGLERVREACSFYLSNPTPYLYAGPTEDRVLEGYSWGTPKARYLSVFMADPDGLRHGTGRVHLRHRDEPLDAWIDRQDVVAPSELRRVTGCWPIRRVHIAGGDWIIGSIRLRRDGSGVFELDGKKRRVHAWFKKGAFVIRTEGKRPRAVASGTIDVLERAADMVGSEGAELEGGPVEWDMGARCKAGPLVRGG